jgi:hypothetical protein
MDDEPNIGQDMLDNMMMDSTNDNDNELIFCAYRLINTNLFNRSDKLQFLKTNEQKILNTLNVRELEFNSKPAPPKPGAKKDSTAEKMALQM